MKKRAYIFVKTGTLCLLLMSSLFIFPAAAQEETRTIPEEHQLPRVVDGADLLNDSQEQKLMEQLDEISERQQCDVAVVTVDGLKGQSPRDYADDFYDYNGYGMGAGDDGMLLLISMEDRDWRITTYGFGAEALTDAGIDYISEKFLPDLSDGNYMEAFQIYGELCDEFITQAKEGDAYDVNHMPREKMDLIWIPGSFLIGLVVALIVTGLMRSQLKSVRRQTDADYYEKKGSRNIRVQRDFFLYRTVAKTARPKENKSGGGSSMHRSSSGRSHGGGGGKF